MVMKRLQKNTDYITLRAASLFSVKSDWNKQEKSGHDQRAISNANSVGVGGGGGGGRQPQLRLALPLLADHRPRPLFFGFHGKRGTALSLKLHA